jgi:hypothetical protein
MSTNMRMTGTPTSIPTTTRSTGMTRGVNTITSIITATNTTLNHVITITGTKNIIGITSTSPPAPNRRLENIRFKQPITRPGAYP